jgi:hypothetical protein
MQIYILELLPGKHVLPIKKNGSLSIESYAKSNKIKRLFNEQIKKIEHITIFIRKPRERFVSGVHSFIEFEKRKNNSLHYDTMLYCIEHLKVQNVHFEPQFFSLVELAKYFNGIVDIKDVAELYSWIPNKIRPAIPEITPLQQKKIFEIKYPNLKYDELLYQLYLDKTIKLDSIVKEIEDAMS